ncbi:MAG TPA: ParB/RepB/Spo0J family partition protein [Pirellulales bacterium]
MNQPVSPPQRRLGRGLEALLGRPLAPGAENHGEEQGAPAVGSAGSSPAGGQSKVPCSLVDPNPFQPRRVFDDAEIESLAQSLKDHGLIQAIVVRQVAGRYQLIAGERRLRAAQKCGWTTIPCRIVEADDRQVTEVAIVENLQRTDLNPLEKGGAFQKYLETYKTTQDELAKRIGVDRSTISNLMRLLELPAPVQDALRRNDISAGHARALLPLGEEKEQVSFCKKIKAEGLSVRAIEALVKEHLAKSEEPSLNVVGTDGESKPAAPPRSEHLAAMEQQFRSLFGTKVDLKTGPKETGKIVIHFTSHGEFERIKSQLNAVPAAPSQSSEQPMAQSA